MSLRLSHTPSVATAAAVLLRPGSFLSAIRFLSILSWTTQQELFVSASSSRTGSSAFLGVGLAQKTGAAAVSSSASRGPSAIYATYPDGIAALKPSGLGREDVAYFNAMQTRVGNTIEGEGVAYFDFLVPAGDIGNEEKVFAACFGADGEGIINPHHLIAFQQLNALQIADKEVQFAPRLPDGSIGVCSENFKLCAFYSEASDQVERVVCPDEDEELADPQEQRRGSLWSRLARNVCDSASAGRRRRQERLEQYEQEQNLQRLELSVRRMLDQERGDTMRMRALVKDTLWPKLWKVIQQSVKNIDEHEKAMRRSGGAHANVLAYYDAVRSLESKEGSGDRFSVIDQLQLPDAARQILFEDNHLAQYVWTPPYRLAYKIFLGLQAGEARFWQKAEWHRDTDVLHAGTRASVALFGLSTTGTKDQRQFDNLSSSLNLPRRFYAPGPGQKAQVPLSEEEIAALEETAINAESAEEELLFDGGPWGVLHRGPYSPTQRAYSDDGLPRLLFTMGLEAVEGWDGSQEYQLRTGREQRQTVEDIVLDNRRASRMNRRSGRGPVSSSGASASAISPLLQPAPGAAGVADMGGYESDHTGAASDVAERYGAAGAASSSEGRGVAPSPNERRRRHRRKGKGSKDRRRTQEPGAGRV
ncbi:unnamed protein product [Amoebophrya sp. A120]|nr:unnamed protein product [Amoebophrya sp. A120]|eukprot:GSA120T00019284001.1